jgi:hypothetical protein
MNPFHDVAVIGGGPYGLSATSHLRAAGLDVRTFGRPMEFWETRMPTGMWLRSSWQASSISDPDGALSLDAYEAARGTTLRRPLPLEDFVRYGRWFQRHAVPDLDGRRVERVGRTPGGFQLRLDDGSEVAARRVVVATGLDALAHRPPQVAALERPLVWHSSEMRDLEPFRGHRTAVVGSGQSAIELAALLHEAGAQVEVIARAHQIRWLRRSRWLHERSGPIRRFLYPPTDVGPIGLSWIVAMPDAFRRLPPRLGSLIAYRCIRPAASGWLVARTAGVAMTLGRAVAAAQPSDGGLRLALDDGTSRHVEHLVLATGYQVRIDSQGILDEPLLAAVRTVDGAPVLGDGFESSVAGLHFVGSFAAPTFGPVMRFVSGTTYTGRALAKALAADRRQVPTPAEPVPALG